MMKHWQLIGDWYQKTSQKKKYMLLGMFIFSILLSLTVFFQTTSYGYLFTNLNAEDASQIIAQLEEKQIAYQLKNQGKDILVLQNLVDKTRLQLMNDSLKLTANVGFELFDKTDFSLSDFSQKINYLRALQGELERTILSLDAVKKVRVHVVLPQQHLFQQNNKPKAAVSLWVKRPLHLPQINSIKHLLTASVEGLLLKNVVIIDQHGNNLSDSINSISNSHLSEKKQLEHYLRAKLTSALAPVFPKNTLQVEVDVRLNHDKLQTELVTPDTKGQIVHEKEIHHKTDNNNHKLANSEELTRERQYHYGEKKEQFYRSNSRIERLTISIILPKNTPATTVEKINRLAKTIIGFDPKRGDEIAVESLIEEIHFAPVFKNIQPKRSHLLIIILISISMTAGISTFVFYLFLRKKRVILLQELNQWINDYEQQIEHSTR